MTTTTTTTTTPSSDEYFVTSTTSAPPLRDDVPETIVRPTISGYGISLVRCEHQSASELRRFPSNPDVVRAAAGLACLYLGFSSPLTTSPVESTVVDLTASDGSQTRNYAWCVNSSNDFSLNRIESSSIPLLANLKCNARQNPSTCFARGVLLLNQSIPSVTYPTRFSHVTLTLEMSSGDSIDSFLRPQFVPLRFLGNCSIIEFNRDSLISTNTTLWYYVSGDSTRRELKLVALDTGISVSAGSDIASDCIALEWKTICHHLHGSVTSLEGFATPGQNVKDPTAPLMSLTGSDSVKLLFGLSDSDGAGIASQLSNSQKEIELRAAPFTELPALQTVIGADSVEVGLKTKTKQNHVTLWAGQDSSLAPDLVSVKRPFVLPDLLWLCEFSEAGCVTPSVSSPYGGSICLQVLNGQLAALPRGFLSLRSFVGLNTTAPLFALVSELGEGKISVKLGKFRTTFDVPDADVFVDYGSCSLNVGDPPLAVYSRCPRFARCIAAGAEAPQFFRVSDGEIINGAVWFPTIIQPEQSYQIWLQNDELRWIPSGSGNKTFLTTTIAWVPTTHVKDSKFKYAAISSSAGVSVSNATLNSFIYEKSIPPCIGLRKEACSAALCTFNASLVDPCFEATKSSTITPLFGPTNLSATVKLLPCGSSALVLTFEASGVGLNTPFQIVSTKSASPPVVTTILSGSLLRKLCPELLIKNCMLFQYVITPFDVTKEHVVSVSQNNQTPEVIKVPAILPGLLPAPNWVTSSVPTVVSGQVSRSAIVRWGYGNTEEDRVTTASSSTALFIDSTPNDASTTTTRRMVSTDTMSIMKTSTTNKVPVTTSTSDIFSTEPDVTDIGICPAKCSLENSNLQDELGDIPCISMPVSTCVAVNFLVQILPAVDGVTITPFAKLTSLADGIYTLEFFLDSSCSKFEVSTGYLSASWDPPPIATGVMGACLKIDFTSNAPPVLNTIGIVIPDVYIMITDVNSDGERRRRESAKSAQTDANNATSSPLSLIDGVVVNFAATLCDATAATSDCHNIDTIGGRLTGTEVVWRRSGFLDEAVIGGLAAGIKYAAHVSPFILIGQSDLVIDAGCNGEMESWPHSLLESETNLIGCIPGVGHVQYGASSVTTTWVMPQLPISAPTSLNISVLGQSGISAIWEHVLGADHYEVIFEFHIEPPVFSALMTAGSHRKAHSPRVLFTETRIVGSPTDGELLDASARLPGYDLNATMVRVTPIGPDGVRGFTFSQKFSKPLINGGQITAATPAAYLCLEDSCASVERNKNPTLLTSPTPSGILITWNNFGINNMTFYDIVVYGPIDDCTEVPAGDHDFAGKSPCFKACRECKEIKIQGIPAAAGELEIMGLPDGRVYALSVGSEMTTSFLWSDNSASMLGAASEAPESVFVTVFIVIVVIGVASALIYARRQIRKATEEADGEGSYDDDSSHEYFDVRLQEKELTTLKRLAENMFSDSSMQMIKTLGPERTIIDTKELEVPRDSVEVGQTPCDSQGRFLGTMGDGSVWTRVAVTVFDETEVRDNKEEVIALLAESLALKSLNHFPLVIDMLGIISDQYPLLQITEYLPHGRLDEFLRGVASPNNTLESLDPLDLSTFAANVGEVIKYMDSLGAIIRGLRAASFVVKDKCANPQTGDREIKLADLRHIVDYGRLSRSDNRELGEIVRWLPPEALTVSPSFSPATDIWSASVVLWEIYTFGLVPFAAELPELGEDSVLHKLLLSGVRPEFPRNVPSSIQALMEEGWASDPQHRPSASEVCDRLSSNLLSLRG